MAAVQDTSPWTSKFTEVDPQSGWCEAWLIPNGLADEPRYGVIFGDVIHNLRCALDYVVTELVRASNTTLTPKHQFPIYRNEAAYKAKVGSVGSPLATGPLGHVKYGDGLIESLQPYKAQPEPRSDPLWAVHRYSNADKHRQVAAAHLPPQPGELQIDFNGTLVEKVDGGDNPNWRPGEEILMARLRFDPPVAFNLRTSGRVTVSVGFYTEAFGADPAQAINLFALGEVCDYLMKVVDLFGAL